jgi:ribonuclease Z
VKVHILGSGTPTPTATRFGSSYVVDVGGDLLMFDCGPATTHKLVKAGLWPTDVNYLFFTHHHFDHDVDYPCFLLCRWDQGIDQEQVLRVFGPRITEALTEGIIGEAGIFAHDWKARINLPGSQRVYVNRGGKLPRPAPEVSAADIEPGWVYESDNWKVTAAHAEHAQPYLDSLAYRVDTDEGSVVVTGDTQPCPTVIELARGADVMLCMCWNHQDVMDADGESNGQTGTLKAGQMAQDAGVGTLVLVHTGPGLTRGGEPERAVADVGQVYSGRTLFAQELDVIDVNSATAGNQVTR